MARRTTTQACFIDVEARTLRIFDAIRRPFAIGHDRSDLDRVLHLRFELAARRAVIANYMNFLSELEIWLGHWKLPPHGSQQHIPSSPNSDIRFLGAFVKELTTEDFAHAVFGGLPAAAVIAFVGYGGAPINVLQWGGRVVLNNGFHRVYALRSIGVTEIPVVIQRVGNPQLEFPPQVAGLPKEYLLGAPRPVVMKDFFEDGFAITLKVRDRLKMVTLGIALNQYDVPA